MNTMIKAAIVAASMLMTANAHSSDRLSGLFVNCSGGECIMNAPWTQTTPCGITDTEECRKRLKKPESVEWTPQLEEELKNHYVPTMSSLRELTERLKAREAEK